MEAALRQPDHAKHHAESEMLSRLFNRPQHLRFRAFFWEPHSRQRRTGEFQDRDHQPEQGNEPGIAATQKNDLLLQLS